MDRQKNRYTPFEGKYHLRLSDFCEKYGRDLKIIQHRTNVKFWEDFDAIVVPTAMASVVNGKVQSDVDVRHIGKALKLLADGRLSDEYIQKSCGLSAKALEIVKNMSDYEKDMYLNKKCGFYLVPEEIDLDEIFEVKKS